jgi:hypothetical protein
MENRKAKQVLSGGWHQWERGDRRTERRRVTVVEYYALMNTNGRMRTAETVPAKGGNGIKEDDRGCVFNRDML